MNVNAKAAFWLWTRTWTQKNPDSLMHWFWCTVAVITSTNNELLACEMYQMTVSFRDFVLDCEILFLCILALVYRCVPSSDYSKNTFIRLSATYMIFFFKTTNALLSRKVSLRFFDDFFKCHSFQKYQLMLCCQDKSLILLLSSVSAMDFATDSVSVSLFFSRISLIWEE